MAQYPNLTIRSVSGNFNLNAALAIAGIAGPVILVITDMVAGLSTPGYNYIRDSISSLAWTDLGWVQTIGFLAIGLLIELFVAGLFFNIRGRRGFGLGIGILAFFGFGLLLIGAFHTDPVNGPNTFEGAIHGYVAKTIFWLYPIAALIISYSMKHDPLWKDLFIYTIVAAVFAMVLMLSSILIPEEDGWFGLFERVLVADEIIWVEVMAIRLFSVSCRNRGQS